MCTRVKEWCERSLDEEDLEVRAREGDLDALARWAEDAASVDYDELGWGD